MQNFQNRSNYLKITVLSCFHAADRYLLHFEWTAVLVKASDEGHFNDTTEACVQPKSPTNSVAKI